MFDADQKLMLVDGNSLLFRAFYALPLLHTRDGIYTNGVYGFQTMLNRALENEKPSHLIVAFDMDRKTFRTEIYTEYKANRSAPPDELVGQFALVREMLAAQNIDYLEYPGYEADDIIGTMSRRGEEAGLSVVILTGDGDALQLVSPDTRVLMTKKGISEVEIYDPQKVKEKWEVEPRQMVDIKALMGDTSDNIPGVPGIGPKTAIKLIKQFQDIDTLYGNIEAVENKKLKEKLVTYQEQAYLSRKLSAIDRHMDIPGDFAEYIRKDPQREQLLDLYRRLEFNNFLQALLDQEENHSGLTTADIEITQLLAEDDIASFMTALEPDVPVVLYLDADYHHPMWAKLSGIYLGTQDKVYYLPIRDTSSFKLEWIRPFLENPDYKKILHNAKFAQVVLLRNGIELRGIAGDTLLLAYVNDPSFEGEDLSKQIFRSLNIGLQADDHASLTAHLSRLYTELWRQTPAELRDLYQQVEMPLSHVLAHMEFSGIQVEKPVLAVISAELAQRIAQDEEKIYQQAGQNFNINSPKQLGKVLFEDLGLRVIKKTKTGYGTGIEILEELFDEHEIIPLIMDYRQLTKLKSTYVDALQELIHPDTGRIHTIFKQAQTSTGRLSSVEPNLQNIPVRVEEGRRIRKAFTVRNKKYYLVSADYSQIDLRTLAHISKDQNLIDTFLQGIDIHTRTAAEIFKVPLDEIDGTLRDRAKAVNFGIIYGISDFGLARDTGVSRQEARRYIDNYLDSYPGVRQYMHDVVEFGKTAGYVETILHRRRYLPDLNARNKMVQSFAVRMALNTPIQGSSADIIKLAMLGVYEQLKQQDLRAEILLQVHDELVLEVPAEELEQVIDLLKDKMENCYRLIVPLEVSIKYGSNWYDMQPWVKQSELFLR
jgi:DNA polymerase-1